MRGGWALIERLRIVLSVFKKRSEGQEGMAVSMNDEGALRQLIAGGEGQHLEFKSSLRYDLKSGTVNKELTKVVCKTISGLMNAYGGTLLIGVGDDGAILGIDADIATLSKKTLDGFELTLRNALSHSLGPEVSPQVALRFVSIAGLTVARVSCDAQRTAVFVRDGGKLDFYVRDGNLTKPLDVRATYEYIKAHRTDHSDLTSAVKQVVLETLQEQRRSTPSSNGDLESTPPWLSVATRRVVGAFLGRLAVSHGWKKIFIISPWISDFDATAALSFAQLLRRLEDDRATAYVVTRPPIKDWHYRAIERIAATRRANIALVPDLHVKLYTAHTNAGEFALLGSANFTKQSLLNREIGVLVNSYADGKRVVSELNQEAAQIYRSPTRHLIHQAEF